MAREPCCEKVGLKKGRWTLEEDEILINYIRVHGEGSWRSLPKNAGLLRCGKSCRLRWINYLREDLKRGSLSMEEEDVIIKLHATLGNRWSLIAGQLPGRTDNEIKNYWNSHLSRRIDTFLRFRNIRSSISSTTVDPIKVAEFSKRKGGGVNRSNAKNRKPDTPIATSSNAPIVADEIQSTSKKSQTISNSPSTNSIVTMDQEVCNIDSELFTWLDNMVNNEVEDQSMESLGKNGRCVDYELQRMEAKVWEEIIGFENIQDGQLNFPPLEAPEPLDDWLFPYFN